MLMRFLDRCRNNRTRNYMGLRSILQAVAKIYKAIEQGWRNQGLVLWLHMPSLTLGRNRIPGDKLFLYTAKTGTPVYCPLPKNEWCRRGESEFRPPTDSTELAPSTRRQKT